MGFLISYVIIKYKLNINNSSIYIKILLEYGKELNKEFSFLILFNYCLH